MPSRSFVSFPIQDLYTTKQQVLNWSARFNTCCFLDSQEYAAGNPAWQCLAAVGEIARLEARSGNAFEELRQFSLAQQDWLFGHFSFDLKSETESVPSRLPDPIGFDDLFFFVPETLILLSRTQLSIGLLGDRHQAVWSEISEAPVIAENRNPSGNIDICQRIPRAAYIQIIEELREHILRGDCYEINFCQEFYAERAFIDPPFLFQALTRVSPSPFSAYYARDEKFLLCASPERYLQRTGDLIRSQPIKGTSPRDLQDRELDEKWKQALKDSEKDRIENVMVVDLVRNDLSRICRPDTVRVEELFGVYSFPQVHQMISTITGRLKTGLSWVDMVAATFPMGSMTGAPKKRVLQLIEQYEKTRRGLFSGAVGYVKPDRDFDFNVVIRSLLYNQRDRYLAYFAGSGITMGSDPDKEYEECLMKISAIEKIIKTPAGTGEGTD
jgi:para-aminobenzoate synthetase component I